MGEGCWDEALCFVCDVCVVQATISGQKAGGLSGRRWRATAPCSSSNAGVSGCGERHGVEGGRHGMLGEGCWDEALCCGGGGSRVMRGVVTLLMRASGTVVPLYEAPGVPSCHHQCTAEDESGGDCGSESAQIHRLPSDESGRTLLLIWGGM